MSEDSKPTGDYLDVPGDVRVLRPWFPLVRRLRERAASGGLSVVRLVVVCDERGYPLHWLEPVALRLEPKGTTSALTRLMQELAK